MRYLKPYDFDFQILNNMKVYFLILMFAFDSKDDLYLYLSRISKKHGVFYLQNYYEIIDRFLPVPHKECFGIEFRQIKQID